ncbi:elongation factor P hydroxylase [Legionella worsleiensis]|uniref:Transporting ATPase n=1 Tax=Legionella worsleiensis TaxID=45076 RepID=A0A0W1A653_9GAMM|nr:elongation factor P hydroxylase [Legionella worsleiensis]KTD76810.1 transporting ATPase [Legionella worsleiensis]STY30661.1 transporting ATPase [Legionella worsleiensis]
MHCYQDLIEIFNKCFALTYNTRLVKGDDEPIYLPADEGRSSNEIHFAHGFYSSALHECSHWFIAGEARRKLIDFGYWYMPDGRNAEQQALFQKVEVKPQALEWILSVAAGHPFRVSVDNLNGAQSDTDSFKKAVYDQVLDYCAIGLPQRALIFRQALCDFYQRPLELKADDFVLSAL